MRQKMKPGRRGQLPSPQWQQLSFLRKDMATAPFLFAPGVALKRKLDCLLMGPSRLAACVAAMPSKQAR